MDKTKKAKITKMCVTAEGTLYKDSIVRVESVSEFSIKVRDDVGKIYHVDPKDLIYIKY
tara:strand:+ start:2341 stop:2517 length:177 start_codon:yes stop_codon:yes gene_type:complete